MRDNTPTPRREGHDDQGGTATEYALMAGLIAAVIVGGVAAVGMGALDLFNRVHF
jgi:Flp pilus assembly pilin Flp